MGENWEEKKENCKREGGKLEMEVGKVIKKRWGLLFFLFLFPFSFFSFAFHFWKQQKFVLGLPKWEFSTGKKHFMLGKKSGKMKLPPQKNMPVTPGGGGGQKICLSTQPTTVPAFRPEPVPPPTEFCLWKFHKFYLIFLSILTTF